jgi:hypothetical protein
MVFGGPSYLHYSNIVHEDPSIYDPSINPEFILTPPRISCTSAGASLAADREVDSERNIELNYSFTKNYCDAILSSRPETICISRKKWPSCPSPDSLIYTETDVVKKLQKARFDSIKHLPPLPKSPKRNYKSPSFKSSTYNSNNSNSTF